MPDQSNVDERRLGLQHSHTWETVTSRPALQSAHDSLRWDVAVSRILSVNKCKMCDAFERESISECTTTDCHAHAICERPYR